MRRLLTVLVPLAAVAALAVLAVGAGGEKGAKEAAPAAPGKAPKLSPDYRMTSHRVVLITDDALNPAIVTLEEGQLVAWISYSAADSVVVFEREVARDMICHSLVNFRLQNDELRSAPIKAGEFASFCQLKPGRYQYKVVRPPGAKIPARIDGEIIVGNPT